MCSKLYISLLLLLTVSIVHAQTYYFRHYEVENGLSNNTVFCSTQDRDGFMWFGTKDGLNRFDGYRFKLFNIDNPDRTNISRDLVGSVACDRDGKLWVGTDKGLYFFNMQQEKLVPFIDTLRDIHNIYCDQKGRLWFISDHTVGKYDFQKKSLRLYPGGKYFHATTVGESPDGTMWIATMDGQLCRYDDATDDFTRFNLFTHSPVPLSRFIQTIFFDEKGSIFVGTTSQGIKQFNIASGDYSDILTYNADGTIIYVRDILSNGDNELWFATESGIYILDRNTGKFQNLRKKFLDPYSISDNAVYTLYKDKEGGIWAGTYFGGLNYYPKQYFAFKKFFPDHSRETISGSAVRDIREDKFGNLWVGTEDAGISKLNPQRNEIVHYLPTGAPGSISNSNIHGMLNVGNDLWIGTFERGLDIMDIKTGKVRKHYRSGPGPNDLKSDFIVTMLQAKDGSIYLGTSLGVFRYNAAKDNFDALPALPPRFYPALLQDSEGLIWAGTHGDGAWCLDPVSGKAVHYNNERGNKNSLSASFVNAIHEDKDGNIWFGTEGGGLSKLEKSSGQFSRYTTYDGLPSNFIFKVLEDNRNSLWITTSKGLVNMNTRDGKMTVYTRANGLLNDQFNYNSGYKDAKGTLYFGSVRGMITFNPSTFGESAFIPKVYLTGFQVNNREMEIGPENSLKNSILHAEAITLPYNESTFSIDFAALSFTSPERTEYTYKMEGVDREWTLIKSNRRVYFTNLGAGTYLFKLRASGPGFAGLHEKNLVIKVLPPFWATNLAYFIYIITGLALLYYLLRSYHKVHESKKQKEIYEAKIDFFTNIAHEIKTPLTLINGPVDNLRDLVEEVPLIKQDVKMLERNTKRLVDLVNQILDFRQVESKGFSLDFSAVNLSELIKENYLSFEALAVKRKISCNINLPAAPVQIQADAEALNKVFSNLFSNAVKYAERMVYIQLINPAKDEQVIRIEVSNDGKIIPADMREKIFEPFVRLKESTKQKGTGIGLALARSLTELHGGKVYLSDERNGMNVFVLELPTGTGTIKQKELIKTVEKPIIS
jgi:signal transduction histidine kinase/ligand-binding sensor domain-containing protein